MDLRIFIQDQNTGDEGFYAKNRDGWEIDGIQTLTVSPGDCRAMLSGTLRRMFVGTLDVLEPLCRLAVQEENGWMPVFLICGHFPGDVESGKQFIREAREKEWPCGVILWELPLLEAVNRAEHILGTFRLWQRSFSGRRGGSRIRALVETCWELSSCPVALLGKDYRLLAWCGLEHGENYLGGQLLSRGRLEPEELEGIRSRQDIAVQYIRARASIVGSILLWRPLEMAHLDYCLPVMAEALEGWMKQAGQYTSMGISDRRLVFEKFIYDLLEGALGEGDTRMNEKLARTAQINGFGGDPYFVCVVFKYKEAGNRPLNPCVYPLKQRYPAGDFAIYRRSIVGLIPIKHRGPEELKLDALEKYLAGQGLIAGISGAGRRMEYFYTFYLMAEEALKLGADGNGSRVCCFEDFRMTYMLDLCRSAFVQRHGHQRQIYLCHPSLADLAAYDAQHHTDLFKVLSTYLKCCKNLAKTGRELSYHRNTVMNKLRKIQEVTGLSLEDDGIYPTLLFSCLMYEEMGE